jgi:arylsulfatase A-like enzyme
VADLDPPARRRPNVLVVLADQWRGTDQGWRGNREVLTPHLDRLAASGVAVPGAYANAPVCCPSRASLLTGRLPHRHRVLANDLPLPDGIPTIADALADAGYRTGWIGKWHLDGLPRDKAVPPERRRGFAYWAGTNCTHDYFDGHYYTGDDPAPVRFEGYEPHVQTELALRFLADPDDRPFFLFVSYNPPHDPYEDVPAEYLERYDPSTLTVRANADDGPSERHLLAQYYAGISAVDDQIGRLVDGLEEHGLRSNTLVVVTADHGDMLGSHGRRAKQVPHEESVAVPLVLSWPDRLPARECGDGVIGLVDLGPTILGLVGAPALPGTDGIDLSAALTGEGALREAVLLLNAVSFDAGYEQGVGEWRGLRTSEMTYARHVDGRPWVLFDNAHDPWQRRNLVGDDSAVAEMERLLDRLLAEAGDPALPADPMLRSLDLVDAWNARELELHGERARVLSAEDGEVVSHN